MSAKWASALSGGGFRASLTYVRNIARQRALKGWKLSRPLKVVPAGLNIAGNRRLAMDVCGLVACIVDQGQHRPHGPHHNLSGCHLGQVGRASRAGTQYAP